MSKKPRPKLKPLARRFDFPDPPPIPVPQTPDGFDRAFGQDRVDMWIEKHLDDERPTRAHLLDLGTQSVTVILRRDHHFAVEQTQEGVAEPFRRDLTCYLYASVVLSETCFMGPLSNISPGPLEIAEEKARSGAYFHPTVAPRWTTADYWRDDGTLSLVIPRKEVYSLLLQAVHRESRRNQQHNLPQRMFRWLERLVQIFPEDVSAREDARKWLRASHPIIESEYI